MNIFFVVHLFLTRQLVQKEGKKKKVKPKIKPCIDKSKDKRKRERVAQLAKAQMRERNKQKCFSSMSRTHSAFPRKAPNQSQLESTSSFLPHLACPTAE